MKNSNMHKARAAKNDEFYTLLPDIERELQHYTEHFRDKVVYCNCDTEQSNFVNYFQENKEKLGIKEFYYSGLQPDGSGSFSSPESLNLLQKADIIVTNPPFSLFRDFVDLLIQNDKKFLIIGNMNAISYKNIFTYFYNSQLWLGVESHKTLEFIIPNHYEVWDREDENGVRYVRGPAISWFTNLTHGKRNEELTLFRKYNPKDYPKYDNYNAIEVSKVADIPVDYEGTMGVPITFLTKYNPEQFEIVTGINGGSKKKDILENIISDGSKGYITGIKGKATYNRIFIKHRKLNK